uniref:Protein Y45F10D.1 putative n=1 Tax=Albugo laibachii Nc14 TaxID=890382 RepID=F0VYK2_9STRA|nr:protein Y45F10D.1 putative [Albugo laibachii Nc14]|eukprot:CCA13866.1 protein Y45F10D.1 putative [Albugo laibachii Nc14]
MTSAEKSDVKENKKPRLTDHEREKIEGLREAGLSLRAIKRINSRSLDTIRRRQVRLILRTAAQGNLSAAQLKAELSLPVSVRCVQRILAQVDWLVYSKMENTFPLTAVDMAARKSWAKGMLLRKDVGSIWDSIIFSDEKKWNLDGPDDCQHYWHDLRQPTDQTKRSQAGGGSVMV